QQLDARAGAAYHMSGALRLHGVLDRAALQSTLDAIVARHESLRTVFTQVDGVAVQVVAPAAHFSLLALDLRSLEACERDAALARHSAEEARAAFDLGAGPLIRGRLLQLADDEHVLLVTMHHIVSDGWSIGVLVREVAALYAACCHGLPDPLPPLSLQYADYAHWQRQWLSGAALQRQIDHWREHLLGAPVLLELPTDRPRPAVQSYAGRSVALNLGPDLSARLNAFAKQHDVTLYMALFCGWATLLSRLSGQLDVVIGSPVANRPRPELEGLIGFFVNTLALRADFSGEPTVAQMLQRVRSAALAAYAHQDLPFEQVVEALQPPRSLSHSPIFQVMFALQNTPQGDLW
ncbi:MAG: non-ribosomal peptide synthetase, partial [Burkholderiales bacterium]|nr:non-ribosomal peptide synthetase [Burkholderiales bacterium]